MIRLPYPRFPMALGVIGLFVIPAGTIAVTLSSSETNGISETSPVISSGTNSAADIEAMAIEIANTMSQQTTGSLIDLAGMYRQEQTQWLLLAPPDSDFVLRPDYGIEVFDPKAFPDDFNKKLVGEMKNECPVYFLIISEDPVTHETVFSSANGGEVARLKPEDGYNPFWLLDSKNPDLYSGKYGSDEIKDLQAA